MEVMLTEAAAEHVRVNGGRVYVWTKARRCCGGGQTLETAFEPPAKREFSRVERTAGVELYMPTHLGRFPTELHLDLQRRPRRLRAYWDGCVWVI